MAGRFSGSNAPLRVSVVLTAALSRSSLALTGTDEVFDEVYHLCWCLDLWEVADTFEYLESGAGPRLKGRRGVSYRDDQVLLTPDQHDRRARN